MNQQDIDNTAAVLTKLKAAGVTTVAEALVLFAAITPPANLDMSEIHKRCGIPYTSVSRILFTLKNLGLVSYESDRADRRRKIVRPTFAV